MIAYTPDGLGRIRTAQPASGTAQTLAELGVAHPHQSDLDFILHAFDSALPYLASIGSQAQWGTVPFSQKPISQEFIDFLQASYDLHSHPNPNPNPDANLERWQHLMVYEVQSAPAQWTRVAAQGISTSFPHYVPNTLANNQLKQATDYLYLNYLISDHTNSHLAKGAGSKLVAFAEQYGRSRAKKHFYGDCWRGNNDRLMSYYQRLGFSPIGPFDVMGKHGPDLPWTGYLFSKPL